MLTRVRTSLSNGPTDEELDEPPELTDSEDEDGAWKKAETREERRPGNKKSKRRWRKFLTRDPPSACACGTDHECAKNRIEMPNETANAVGEIPGWEELDIMVDSGASVTVINEDMVRAVDASGARPNVKYEVADGSLIENMGQKTFMAVTDTGVTNQMTAQVTEVKKALLSVAKIVQAGNRVVFDNNNNFIENTTNGKRITIEQKNGSYVMKVWIPRDQKSPF